MSTLGHRLRSAAVWSITLAVSLTFLFSSLFEAWNGRRQALDDVRSVSAVLERNLRSALAFNDPTSAAATVASVAGVPDIEHATLFDQDGQLFAEYRRGAENAQGGHAAHPLLPDARQPEAMDWRHIVVTTRVQIDGQFLGQLVVEKSLEELWTAQLTRLLAAAVALVALLAGLRTAARVHGDIERPVRALVDVMDEVARSHRYELRAPE